MAAKSTDPVKVAAERRAARVEERKARVAERAAQAEAREVAVTTSEKG